MAPPMRCRTFSWGVASESCSRTERGERGGHGGHEGEADAHAPQDEHQRQEEDRGPCANERQGDRPQAQDGHARERHPSSPETVAETPRERHHQQHPKALRAGQQAVRMMLSVADLLVVVGHQDQRPEQRGADGRTRSATAAKAGVGETAVTSSSGGPDMRSACQHERRPERETATIGAHDSGGDDAAVAAEVCRRPEHHGASPGDSRPRPTDVEPLAGLGLGARSSLCASPERTRSPRSAGSSRRSTTRSGAEGSPAEDRSKDRSEQRRRTEHAHHAPDPLRTRRLGEDQSPRPA